jgi:hypothetical protein
VQPTIDEETTDDPVVADVRNFYKVELRRRDRFVERMLYAGTLGQRGTISA